MHFKQKLTLEERLNASNEVLERYPNSVPVIITTSSGNIQQLQLTKFKYIVPRNLTFNQFVYYFRKNINIKAEQALFMYINNKLIPTTQMISNIYEDHKDSDNFLYMTVALESTFG